MVVAYVAEVLVSLEPIEIHILLWEGSSGRDLQVGILEAAGSDSCRGGVPRSGMITDAAVAKWLQS